MTASTRLGPGGYPIAAIPQSGSNTTGDLSSTEALDTAAFSAAEIYSGDLASTEAADIAAFSASEIFVGNLAATEAADTAAFSAAEIESGSLAATEAADTASFTATEIASGDLAATEAADAAAFNASEIFSGDLSVTEAPDVAAFSSASAVTGDLASTEAIDVAAFSGTLINFGTLAASEAPDSASFTGTLINFGVLAAAESPDTASFSGSSPTTGAFATSEAADTALFSGTVPVVATVLPIELPILPNAIAAEASVEITFDTSVITSESGISGRKLFRDQAIRNYSVSLGPDDAKEIRSIILATIGNRWPFCLRDYNDNYQLTDEPQTWVPSTDGGTVKLHRSYTPSTGTRTYAQRVLLLDERDVDFTVKVNGSPATWAISTPGTLDVVGLTSGDTVTVTGEYLIPICFAEDSITSTMHALNTFEVSDIKLREILEQELIDLT